MLREIAGPAGPLEALLEEPAAGAGVNRDGLLERGGRGAAPRAAVVLAHPHPQYGGTMHTKAVFQSRRHLPHRLRRAAVQLPRRGQELELVRRWAWREG
jgi:alpha/beta superfamily hydrolase